MEKSQFVQWLVLELFPGEHQFIHLPGAVSLAIARVVRYSGLHRL